MVACRNSRNIPRRKMSQTEQNDSAITTEIVPDMNQSTTTDIELGMIAEQMLDGSDGEIYYSYYLPENYDEDNCK